MELWKMVSGHYTVTAKGIVHMDLSHTAYEEFQFKKQSDLFCFMLTSDVIGQKLVSIFFFKLSSDSSIQSKQTTFFLIDLENISLYRLPMFESIINFTNTSIHQKRHLTMGRETILFSLMNAGKWWFVRFQIDNSVLTWTAKMTALALILLWNLWALLHTTTNVVVSRIRVRIVMKEWCLTS